MVKIEASKIINAPVEEVWSIISDPEKMAEIGPSENSVARYIRRTIRIVKKEGNILIIEFETEWESKKHKDVRGVQKGTARWTFIRLKKFLRELKYIMKKMFCKDGEEYSLLF